MTTTEKPLAALVYARDNGNLMALTSNSPLTHWLKHTQNAGALAIAHPPAVGDIYAAYDRLRQDYIWRMCVKHFNKRDDDPAPMLHKSLLDIGCGVSSIGEFMALAGAEVSALDPDLPALNQAEEHAKNRGTPVTFIPGRVEDMLKHASKYDVVICMDVMEYVDHLDKFLWVMKQLVNPGGLIILSTISRTPWAWFYHIFLSEYIYHRTPRGSRTYKQFRTPEMLQQQLAKHGLVLENIQPLKFDPMRGQWHPHTYGSRYLATARQT